jgi:hypothetical protein
MLREQKKDSFCNEQIQKRLTANGEYILDMDGVLYRRVKGEKLKLEVRETVIQEEEEERKPTRCNN